MPKKDRDVFDELNRTRRRFDTVTRLIVAIVGGLLAYGFATMFLPWMLAVAFGFVVMALTYAALENRSA